jgi:hypothetical protein
MNSKKLAEKLHARGYGREMTKDEEVLAKENNLVVVFGYSDDNMEFRGAIYDEFSCFDGGIAYLDKSGLYQNKCDCEDCPNFSTKGKESIEAIWDQDGFSWIYKTDIPHETFDILDGHDSYCRGIVFSLDDLERRLTTVNSLPEPS